MRNDFSHKKLSRNRRICITSRWEFVSTKNIFTEFHIGKMKIQTNFYSI